MSSPSNVDSLIEEGQALVHSLASRIYHGLPVKVEIADLIAYGEVGLAEAARDFDPRAAPKFTTFAYYRIRGAIYDGVSKMCWMSRGRYRRFRYQQVVNEVMAEDARQSSPTSKTLEEDANWFSSTTEKLAFVFLASQQGEGPDSSGNAEFEDPAEAAPSMVARREVGEKLHEMVDALPHQASMLIRSIYFEGATLQQAAQRLGISKSWASRLHAKTLEQLGASLRRLGVND